jgi:hypothetical protein
VASEYLSLNGKQIYNGVVVQGSSSDFGEKFHWNSNCLVFTSNISSQAIRFIWNGSFNVNNGTIIANVTTYSVFAFHRLGGDGVDGPYEVGSSWNIKPEYSSFQGGLGDFLNNFLRSSYEQFSSVNYFYRSQEGALIVPKNGPFGNIPYYANRDSIKDLLNVSLFPENWWLGWSSFKLPTTGSASSNTGTSTTSTLTTTAAVDTLTGTAKKADTFDFSTSPNYNSSADRITNFSAKDKDKVQISSSIFGLSGTGTFKIAKNSKDLTKLLATDNQFIYNKADGGLYFNQNGATPGFGSGGIFAILDGKPTLGTSSVSVVS